MSTTTNRRVRGATIFGRFRSRKTDPATPTITSTACAAAVCVAHRHDSLALQDLGFVVVLHIPHFKTVPNPPSKKKWGVFATKEGGCSLRERTQLLWQGRHLQDGGAPRHLRLPPNPIPGKPLAQQRHRLVADPIERGGEADELLPWGRGCGVLDNMGGMFARRAPGACPARYLCIKYLISSPKFILTLGSPPSRPH